MSLEDVELIYDNCGTIYTPGRGKGDIGENIALHPESEYAGFSDYEDFTSKVEDFNETGNKSDALIYNLAETSETDNIDLIARIATEAQIPEDYGEGYVDLVESFNAENTVVTAGWRLPAEKAINSRLNGSTPVVLGAELEQLENGLNVGKYCSGNAKLETLYQKLGVNDLSEDKTIAFGNSDSNDGPMMEEAKLGIGRGRAKKTADLYTPQDNDFWTRGSLAVIAGSLLNDENPMDNVDNFLEGAPSNSLEQVELKSENPLAKQVSKIYEDVKNSSINENTLCRRAFD